jgi:ElaB/YqjD/DUF883 family membrane-anchored ribosome-binding protein
MERAIETGSVATQAGWSGNMRSGNDAGNRAGEWRNLLADVEDLIKKIAHVDDLEVAKVRAKVEQTLARAKSTAKESGATVRAYARDASSATDEYVHESPWTAIGLAAAVGVVVGFLASRR